MDDLLREAIATYRQAAADFGDPDAVALAAAAIDGDKAALKEISPALKIRVASDIPLERAWKTGRRVYVRSAKGSALSEALWGTNATWAHDDGAHYIGTGKLDALLPLIREAEGAKSAAGDVKARGHWVRIPYAADGIRAKAKEIIGGEKGEFDGTRKEWAMPTEERRTEIAAMVDAYEAASPGRKPRASSGGHAPLTQDGGKCAECGKRRGKHLRYDSSGIGGLVCDFCNREPDYVLSFA